MQQVEGRATPENERTSMSLVMHKLLPFEGRSIPRRPELAMRVGDGTVLYNIDGNRLQCGGAVSEQIRPYY